VTVLTRTAALEAIADGIRINSISRAPVDTPIVPIGPARTKPHAMQGSHPTNPSKRVAKLDEIASAVLWLCSDGAGLHGRARFGDRWRCFGLSQVSLVSFTTPERGL